MPLPILFPQRGAPPQVGSPETAPAGSGSRPAARYPADQFATKIQSAFETYSPRNLSAACHRFSQDSKSIQQRILHSARGIAARLTGRPLPAHGTPYHPYEPAKMNHAQGYPASPLQDKPLPAHGTPYHPYVPAQAHPGQAQGYPQRPPFHQQPYFQQHGNPPPSYFRPPPMPANGYPEHNPGFFPQPGHHQQPHQHVPPRPPPESGTGNAGTAPKPEAAKPAAASTPAAAGLAVPNYNGAPMSMSEKPSPDVVDKLRKNGMTETQLQSLKQDIRNFRGQHGNSALYEAFDKKYSNVFSGKSADHGMNLGLVMTRIKIPS